MSKDILKRYKIKDEVELVFEEGQIILKPLVEPRQGWEEAFAKMNEAGDDDSLIDDVFDDEDFEEWE